VPLRGVSPEAFKVHDKLKIVEGRNLEFGRNEIIAAAPRPGSSWISPWAARCSGARARGRLVGIFDDGRRRVGVGALVRREGAAARLPAGEQLPVRLRQAGRPDSFQQLKDALTANPQAHRHRDARGGILRQPDADAADDRPHDRRHHRGADGRRAPSSAPVITMYTAVASRTREIATLRALGFGSVPVVVSVLVEAALLSAVGGLVGGADRVGSPSTATRRRR
jgi:putative ABC transport system permease protein